MLPGEIRTRRVDSWVRAVIDVCLPKYGFWVCNYTETNYLYQKFLEQADKSYPQMAEEETVARNVEGLENECVILIKWIYR